MTEETRPTEKILLSHTLFQALLNLTGGDVELHTPKKRALVRALHNVRQEGVSQWEVRMDAEQVEAMKFHLDVWYLNNPKRLRTRFNNRLRSQSAVYELLCQEDEEKEGTEK